ncbi:replication-relaxation family protein [Streptomyces microflavus]|nr:replication-relaxation family protein [Streptomyces microflavus]
MEPDPGRSRLGRDGAGPPGEGDGGTARDAAKAGAPHALAVTDTIDAFCQSPPKPTKPIARRTTPVPAPVRELSARPAGLGQLRGWETEVPLPVSGTFTTPARGSLRADAVLTAPEAGVPVLFVEVDNHTEPDAVVAWKIESYRRSSSAPPRTTADATCRSGGPCGTPRAATGTRPWLWSSRRTGSARRLG